MFWRRSRPKEEKAGEPDDLAKLQKQFGIKPVSDADVQAEFQALFGAANSANAASGLSPMTEQLLFGAGADEEEEEARILRDLQLNGVDLDDCDSEGQQEANHELRGVLDEAHATAQQNYAREQAEMSGATAGPNKNNAAPLSSERAAQVHALKLQAVALKREGKMQEALAKFREAKQLQEQSSKQVGGKEEDASSEVGNSTVSQEVKQRSARPPMDTVLDEDDVEVTDEDMQDPEYLAQLAKMGLTDDDESGDDAVSTGNEVTQQLSALEAEIEHCKVQAVQLKRQNQIADALACMRKVKELEATRDSLRSSETELKQAAATPDATESRNKSGSDDTLVANAAGAADGMNGSTVTGDLILNNPAPITIQSEKRELAFTGKAIPDKSSKSRVLRSAPSIDEDFLIDAFDDKSDSEDEGTLVSSSTYSSSVLTSVVETEASVLQVEPVMPRSNGADISDLKDQFGKARHAALSLKRKGDIQGALEYVRRSKQIQHLIELKQQASENTTAKTAPTQDLGNTSQFQEIEHLLVDFGNRAMSLAKENMFKNREKASEWLGKRKQYEAELEKLRRTRQNPLQKAPTYEIVKASRQVEFELPFIREDQIKVSIKSVNGLPQVAGQPVHVKFCLSFPSATPHVGQTNAVQVSSGAPFTAEISSGQSEFIFKLPRSRGTMRLFEIKKAIFEVWKPSTLFRNAELVARAYQELSPLLACCEIDTHLPFLGSNRKPCGGDIEISLQMRHPLKEKEYRLETVEELVVGKYPEISATSQEHLTMPSVTLEPAVDPSNSVDKKNISEDKIETPSGSDTVDDPHHVDLIVSYDVINEELGKLEAKLPSLTGEVATELSDRYDSLALKKQLLEIEMQTGKLTLDMYVEKLHGRISADRALISQLLAKNRRLDAARVLHRVKTMEKELEGTEGDPGQE